MVGQLGLHRPLQQPLRQPGEHATRPNELLFRPGAGEQFVDQLVRQLLTQPRGRTFAATPRGRGRLALRRPARARLGLGRILLRELSLVGE